MKEGGVGLQKRSSALETALSKARAINAAAKKVKSKGKKSPNAGKSKKASTASKSPPKSAKQLQTYLMKEPTTYSRREMEEHKIRPGQIISEGKYGCDYAIKDYLPPIFHVWRWDHIRPKSQLISMNSHKTMYVV